jgi:hypothetical protein
MRNTADVFGLGWVTKIYYLELLRALEGTLSRWSRPVSTHQSALGPRDGLWAFLLVGNP